MPTEYCAITVRPAEAADWPTITDYNCRLAAESEHKQLDRELVAKGVQALLADPSKGRYFVALADGNIVGQMMHTREWSDWRNGDIWWVQSVYVAPDYRRRGVFRLLFQHVEHLARSLPDVVGLRLYVERDNQHARATYQRLGLIEPGYLVMERLFVPINV